MSLDWAYALKMASDNSIQTIQEYLMLCMKIMLTNLTWAVSTLSDYIYVVFLFVVALFNSLSLSNKGYRPVEALMSCLPTNAKICQQITKIQNSVVQVFYATFRLAIFYTVWTCTAHKMIGTTLVSYMYIIVFEIFQKQFVCAIMPPLCPYFCKIMSFWVTECFMLKLRDEKNVNLLIIFVRKVLKNFFFKSLLNF